MQYIVLQVPAYAEWFNIIYDGDAAVYTYHQPDCELMRDDIQEYVDSIVFNADLLIREY